MIQKKKIKDMLLSLDSLIFFKDIQKTSIVRKVSLLFKEVLEDKSSDYNPINLYHSFIAELFNYYAAKKDPGLKNLWQDFILDHILRSENPLSEKLEKEPLEKLDGLLLEAAKRDMYLLKDIHDFDFLEFNQWLRRKLKYIKIDFPYNNSFETTDFPYPESYYRESYRLKKQLNGLKDWAQALDELSEFYKKTGCGIFGKYWAFKWDEDKKDLKGISDPDPIRLQDLVGYEDQRKDVIENTKQFLHGYTSNNLLLYGDRGTGKSSTIKALIHEFGESGLRLVEVTKYQLARLPQIVEKLKNKKQYFIIFVDDLSFEENETEYKHLKAVLEGSLEAQPQNVLIYATSNRRHLIREFFKDRDNEVGFADTMQEKLSLSDRFGKTVIFSMPSREEYLNIVRTLAQKFGIDLPREELERLALQWEKWHNERSGRTAKQFIKDLYGKLKLKQKQ